MTNPIVVGSRVKYSVGFLRSTGMYTGPMPFARGTVTALQTLYALTVARVKWDKDDCPEAVNVNVLVLESDLETRHN